MFLRFTPGRCGFPQLGNIVISCKYLVSSGHKVSQILQWTWGSCSLPWYQCKVISSRIPTPYSPQDINLPLIFVKKLFFFPHLKKYVKVTVEPRTHASLPWEAAVVLHLVFIIPTGANFSPVFKVEDSTYFFSFNFILFLLFILRNFLKTYITFKGYVPFIIVTESWPYSPCFIIHLWTYRTTNSLYLPLPHP